MAAEAAEEKPASGLVVMFKDPAGKVADGAAEEICKELRGADRGSVGVAGGEEVSRRYGLAGVPGVVGGEGAEPPTEVTDGAGEVFWGNAIGPGAELVERADGAGIDR